MERKAGRKGVVIWGRRSVALIHPQNLRNLGQVFLATRCVAGADAQGQWGLGGWGLEMSAAREISSTVS